eukprot:gene3777-4724_t
MSTRRSPSRAKTPKTPTGASVFTVLKAVTNFEHGVKEKRAEREALYNQIDWENLPGPLFRVRFTLVSEKPVVDRNGGYLIPDTVHEIPLTQGLELDDVRKYIISLFNIDDVYRVEIIGKTPRQWQSVRVNLNFKKYLYDERLPGYGPTMIKLTQQSEWKEVVAGHPWDGVERCKRIVGFLMEKLSAQSAELQQEGAEGFAELSTNRELHQYITHDVLMTLVKRLELRGGQEKLIHNALLAVWRQRTKGCRRREGRVMAAKRRGIMGDALSVTSAPRRTFLELGALARVLQVLRAVLGPGSFASSRRLQPAVRASLRQLCIGCFCMLVCDKPGRAKLQAHILHEEQSSVRTGGPPLNGLQLLAELAIGGPGALEVLEEAPLHTYLPGTLSDTAAECLGSLLYQDNAVRMMYGRTNGLRSLVPLLCCKSHTIKFAASAAVCAFSVTAEGRSLLATSPCLTQLFEHLTNIALAVVKAAQGGETSVQLRTAGQRLAHALWGCCKAASGPVGGAQGNPGGISFSLGAFQTFLQAITGAAQCAMLESMAFCMTSGLCALAQDRHLVGLLLTINVEEALLQLLGARSPRIQAIAMSAVGFVLEHEEVEFGLLSPRLGAQREAQLLPPLRGDPHYQHRLQLLSPPLISSLLKVQADISSLDLQPWTSLDVSHGLSMNLMLLSTVGGVRGKDELHRLVELLGSPSAHIVREAATAMWALFHEAENMDRACAVGAVEGLLKALSFWQPQIAHLTDQEAVEVKTVECVLAALWLLLEHPGKWLHDRESWKEVLMLQAAPAEYQEEEPVPEEQASQGSGFDEEAFWEEQKRKYEEQEAIREQEEIAAEEARLKAEEEAKLAALNPPPTPPPPAETFDYLDIPVSARATVDDVATLVEVMKMRDGDENTRDNVKELAANILHVLVQRHCAFRHETAESDVGTALLLAANSSQCTEGLRNSAARLFHELSASGEFHETLGGGGGLHEEAVVSLMRSGCSILEARGTRMAAGLVVDLDGKSRLATVQGVEALVGLVEVERLRPRDAYTSDTEYYSLTALLNLSSTTDHQVNICRLGLATLLRVTSNHCTSEMCRVLARGALENIAQHPSNRTLMFTAELRKKALHLKSSGASRDAPTLPGTRLAPLSGSPKDRRMIGVKSASPDLDPLETRAVQERFSDWLDDAFPKVPNPHRSPLPVGGQGDRASSEGSAKPHPLVTHMRCNWRAPSPNTLKWLATPKVPLKQPAVGAPKDSESDRESLPTLKKKMCGPLANIWTEPAAPTPALDASSGRGEHTFDRLYAAGHIRHYHPHTGLDVNVVPDPILNAAADVRELGIAAGDIPLMGFGRGAKTVWAEKHPAIFGHVEGSTVCKSLYKHYTLPDGTLAHMYFPRKRDHDELEVEPEGPPPFPYTFQQILQEGFPVSNAMFVTMSQLEVALQKGEDDGRGAPQEPPAPVDEAQAAEVAECPRDDSHVLVMVPFRPRPPKSKYAVTTSGVTNLLSGFLECFLEVQASVEVDTLSEDADKEAWDVHKSIFAPRKKECDSRNIIDTPSCIDKMFEKDWARCIAKERFFTLIMKRASFDDADHYQNRVKNMIKNYYRAITGGHRYFSSLGTGDVSNMQFNEWSTFLVHCGIPDPKSKFCKLKDLDVVFVTTDFEGDRTSREAAEWYRREKGGEGAKSSGGVKTADSKALLRFEFVEALVRTAICKYAKDLSRPIYEAIQMLFERNIMPTLPWEALEDRNEFRSKRLYTEEVEQVYLSQLPFLKSLFKYYCFVGSSSRRGGMINSMTLDGWGTLLYECGIMNDMFTKREAKMCFTQSIMGVIDETKNGHRLNQLTFIEFLEAFGRMSEFVSPPTPEELKAALKLTDATKITFKYFFMLSRGRREEQVEIPRRDSAYDMQLPEAPGVTRPLNEKLAQMIEVCTWMLAERANVASVTAITRWLSTCETPSGGVSM